MTTRPRAGIIANVSWASLEQVFRLAVSFFVMVRVISYLGPDSFGLYSYVLSIVGMLTPLTAFGLEQVVICKLVERPDARASLLGACFAIRSLSGIIAYVAAIVIVLVLDHGDNVRLQLVAAGAVMLLLQAFDTIAFYFKSVMGGKSVALSRLAGLGAVTVSTLVLMALQAGVGAMLWIRSIEAGVTGLALVIAYRMWGGTFRAWRFDRYEVKQLLKAGFPLLVASFAVTVYNRADQVMLGQMASTQELGYYGVAVRLAEVANFVPMTLVTALYPSLIECYRRDQAVFVQRVQGLYNLMALTGYVIAGVGTLAAPMAFHLLFGSRYDPAVPMFVVLVWSTVFVCLGVGMGPILAIRGRYWTSAITTTVGMVANIGLNLWLIPLYGGLGAACATLISFWIAVHGSCLLIRELRPTFVMLIRALLWPDIRLLRKMPLLTTK